MDQGKLSVERSTASKKRQRKRSNKKSQNVAAGSGISQLEKPSDLEDKTQNTENPVVEPSKIEKGKIESELLICSEAAQNVSIVPSTDGPQPGASRTGSAIHGDSTNSQPRVKSTKRKSEPNKDVQCKDISASIEKEKSHKSSGLVLSENKSDFQIPVAESHRLELISAAPIKNLCSAPEIALPVENNVNITANEVRSNDTILNNSLGAESKSSYQVLFSTRSLQANIGGKQDLGTVEKKITISNKDQNLDRLGHPDTKLDKTKTKSKDMEGKKKGAAVKDKKGNVGEEQKLLANNAQDKSQQKSKAELKAERRAIQEAQRAAKAEIPIGGNAMPVGSGGKASLKAEKKELPASTAEIAGSDSQKSKAEMRAERRAIQEAQRATKTAKKTDGTNASLSQSAAIIKPNIRVPAHVQVDDPVVEKKLAKKLASQQIPQRTKVQKKVLLFSHLHQYEREVSLTQGLSIGSCNIHPAIVRLGLQYAEGVVCGSNARCLAFLHAMKQVINDYVTPPQKELSRDLEAKIKPYISFLQQCRPLSVSMGNAIKFLKWEITNQPTSKSDVEIKGELITGIDDYIMERIILADTAIASFAMAYIDDGDVILVYAYSSVLNTVLKTAHEVGKKFRVIVVDSRPKMEGKKTLVTLVAQGIKCSYFQINALCYIMQEVKKVFLGAHALLANGYVMSRVGSSQVALVAKAYNVPVLVCCETYKFSERVQSDSFVFNELGDPDDIVQTNTSTIHLADWRDLRPLSLLNLLYDVTPPDLVTAVVTDLGMIPCTSVPVVLRCKPPKTTSSN